jgi:cytochrome c5
MTDPGKTGSQRGIWQLVLVLGCLLVAAVIVVACSSGSSSSTTTSSGMTTVNVMLSDPATCAGPDGPFAHVYVTITDVQANVSSTAGDTDSGWVDLTPNLSSSPKQVDLLGHANNQCFLATLGDTQQLQAGTYQQIRLILADNSASISSNACGSSANCVVLSSDSSVHPLLLSSESKTGLKIPSGQIANGGFTIAAGQTKDLDIDFNTCESILREGNGQYRLKPVLHAGEVVTTSSSINGKVLDSATGNPVSGTVVVSLEQPDSGGVDRVTMSAPAGADGTFTFCPLPSGTYDVVIVGTRTDGTIYEPSIVTGVATGSTTGTINLNLPTVIATSSVSLNGLVTSQNSAMPPAGTVADVQISALEAVGSTTFTIPLPPTSTQSAATLAVETAAPTTALPCPTTGTDCVSYTMELSSGGPYAGAWKSSGTTLMQSAPLATYTVDGMGFVPSSGGKADCSPSEMKIALPVLTGPGPFSVPVSSMNFTACQ